MKKGFTLVEMIIVVAVIAMLLSFTLAFLSDSKKKARDSRREEDMKEIQNALGLYAASSHIYPICSQGVIEGGTDCLSRAFVSGQYMIKVPTDPLGGGGGSCGAAGNYVYCYTSDGFTYTLEYALETDNINGKTSGWQSVGP